MRKPCRILPRGHRELAHRSHPHNCHPRHHPQLSSPDLIGQPSTPRPLDLSPLSLEYWIPAFAGMTSGTRRRGNDGRSVPHLAPSHRKGGREAAGPHVAGTEIASRAISSIAQKSRAVTFIVHASKGEASTATIRLSAVVAIAKGRALAEEGWQVFITGPDGNRYHPAEFDRLLSLSPALHSRP